MAKKGEVITSRFFFIINVISISALGYIRAPGRSRQFFYLCISEESARAQAAAARASGLRGKSAHPCSDTHTHARTHTHPHTHMHTHTDTHTDAQRGRTAVESN